MTAITLYQLADKYRSLAQKLEELTDDPQAIADTLEGEAMELEDKARAVACYIANIEAEADAYAAHAKTVADKAKAIQRRADSLRDYLKLNMEACGITEIKPNGAGPTLKIKQNPESVEITDAALIPDEYLAPPAPRAPDKTKIKEMLKAGAELTFARLTRGTRLEMK
jgi:predicted nuclease with TOPRIM domain